MQMARKTLMFCLPEVEVRLLLWEEARPAGGVRQCPAQERVEAG